MFPIVNFFRSRSEKEIFPSKFMVVDLSRNLAINLFPTIEGGGCKPVNQNNLRKRLISLLKPLKPRLPDEPDIIADKFFNNLHLIKKQLEQDAEFIALNDPAASGIDEVILAYPGFYAILIYRLAHSLAGLGVPVIPRVITEHAHSLTGIDINPGANIGEQFFIDHGTGIVIGETAIIGNRVKLYQGVTIGALSVNKAMASTKRHPTIEDDVIIYAGSTILGGNTIIGHDSVIGGNVWLTESVPPYSMVYNKHQTTVKDREKKGEI